MRPKARHFILGIWPHTATVRLAQTLGVTVRTNAPMQQKANSIKHTEGIKAYLLGGVALVLGVLWWLWPGEELKPMPMGRQEQGYREEIAALFGAQAAFTCEYWSKHLYIKCGAVEVNDSVLASRGWHPKSGANKVRWYVKDRWRMKLNCLPENAKTCELEIWPKKD